MYGYQGQYGQPPGAAGYGGYPGAPPGMAPPGTAGAPGIPSPSAATGPPQQNANLPGRPGGLPPSFQPPPNFANINFNAPVIRLGTMGSGKDGVTGQGGMMGDGTRRGLGMDRGMDQRPRENAALIAPTREEIMRTLFIGKIPPTMLDADLEAILRCAGRLRKWMRAFDGDNKPCTFGFAEYEDAESLENAIQILPDIEVPATHVEKSENTEESPPVERVRLLVQIDDASRRYADEWAERRGEDEEAAEFRIHQARESLAEVLADIFRGNRPSRDQDGDLTMQGTEIKADPLTGEIITIPLTGDDELSDIPAEMRETVAAEIAAFRQRSNERDMDRLRREKEIEAAEKRNSRNNRLGSPPRSAPTGPAAANGIPLGPKGAPSGPKGYQGGQNGINGSGLFTYVTPEEEDSDASDEELERRRLEKKEAEQEKLYLDMERKWLNRERSRNAAVEREKTRDQVEFGAHEKEKDEMARLMKEFNDDSESFRRSEDFYRDRSTWVRNRQAFLKRERKADDEDRAQEAREKARDAEKSDRNRPFYDHSSMERQTDDLRSGGQDQPRFKISLGAAAQRAQAAAPRRTVAEVEGLLEDEEEEAPTAKRTLIPIKYDTAAETAGLTEEERQQAARQLAAEIPTSKEGLWAWDMKWEFVDDAILQEQIRPFVEKKMMEYLGVQEEMLVDVVEEHIKKRGSPEELVGELEGPLDEEAEVLVMKLWRVLIFCSESEKRGLT